MALGNIFFYMTMLEYSCIYRTVRKRWFENNVMKKIGKIVYIFFFIQSTTIITVTIAIAVTQISRAPKIPPSPLMAGVWITEWLDYWN